MKTRLKLSWFCLTILAVLSLLPAAHAYYDPAAQRWLNRDPIGESGGINLYASVANNPLNRLDSFGEADVPKDKPPATSPPVFGEKPFKPGTENCLCYGLDRPGRELQPDGGYGLKNAKKCPELLDQIKKNYKGDNVPKDGKCPSGSHKIAVFSDGDGGYHIQRQDSDGGWSEMGLGNSKDTYPPRKCKRGDRGKDCGDLCVPDQPK